MANITGTSFANAVKTQFERRLLIRAVARLVHGRWGVRARINKYSALEWRKYAGLAAVTTALTEGTTPTEQSAPTITQVTATPSWYGAWIEYTDKIDLTIYDPLVSEVSGILGEQAGVSVDTLIRNEITANATKDYSQNQTARANLDAPLHNITYGDLVKLIATAEAADTLPVDGDDYIIIMHPHTWATLMMDPTFVNLFVRESNPALRSGYMGRILRCKVFVTSNSREYTDGGVSNDDVYSLLLIGGEAYGVVGMAGLDPKNVDSAGPMGKSLSGAGKRASPVELILKGLGSSGTSDPLNQRATIAWKTAFQAKVLQAAFLYDMEHTNEFSAE